MGLFFEYMMYIRGWQTFHDTGQIEKKSFILHAGFQTLCT